MKRKQACSTVCKNKKQFKNDSQANRRAKEIFNKDGVKLYAYCCNVCNKWHLTSKDEKQRKSIKKHIAKTQRKHDNEYQRQIENEADYWKEKHRW
jgi:hypothetical protein